MGLQVHASVPALLSSAGEHIPWVLPTEPSLQILCVLLICISLINEVCIFPMLLRHLV